MNRLVYSRGFDYNGQWNVYRRMGLARPDPGRVTKEAPPRLKTEVKREGSAARNTNGRVVNLSGLRKRNFPYIFIWVLYYAWVVAFATWWTASPLTETVFSMPLRGLMHAVNLISSAVFVFLIRKKWVIKGSHIGAVILVAGMAAYFLLPDTGLRIAAAVISAIAIGCVNICILIPFVFTLNNTEKLYAVVGSYLLIQLISLFQEHNAVSGIELVLSLAILAASLSVTLFFKKADLADSGDETQCGRPYPRRIYWTIFLNCAIAVLCRGAGKGILNVAAVGSDLPVLTWYYIGGLTGCFLFVFVYAFSRKAFLWLGNITFSSVAMGLLCYAFAGQLPGLAVLFAVLIGIGNTVGMINMYYIIGVVGKKYNSMRYLRLSILFIGICGGISGVVVGNVISSIGTFELSIVASIVSAAVMTLFMAASPVFAQTEYENDWAKDSQLTDIDNEQLYLFQKYELSKRETEVCKLLVQGYTMRQVSGILSIAYSTVNTYCTSAYRKLGINSRTELLLMFKDYAGK